MVTSRLSTSIQPVDEVRGLLGAISYLPMYVDDFSKYSIPPQACGHPVVIVLDKRNHAGTVCICTITSLDETSLESRYPLGQEYRRRPYVPIFPNPVNVYSTPTQLKLEDGAVFQKLSYVRMDRMYQVPINILKSWSCKRTKRPMKLSSASIDGLQDALGLTSIDQNPHLDNAILCETEGQAVVHSRPATVHDKKLSHWLVEILEGQTSEDLRLLTDYNLQAGYGSIPRSVEPRQLNTHLQEQRKAPPVHSQANQLPTSVTSSPRKCRTVVGEWCLATMRLLCECVCTMLSVIATAVWRRRYGILYILVWLLVVGGLGYGAYRLISGLAHLVSTIITAVVAALSRYAHAILAFFRSGRKWCVGVWQGAAVGFRVIIRSLIGIVEMIKKVFTDIRRTR